MAIVQAQEEPRLSQLRSFAPKCLQGRSGPRGWLCQEIGAEKVGTAMLLGAGRATRRMRPWCWPELLVKRAYVEKGQPLVRLYTNRSDTVTEAGRLFIESIVIGPQPAQRELVIDHIS